MGTRLLEGRSILVVEDEPLIGLDIAQTLENAGAKTVSANTLKRALDRVEQEALSAAVLDQALSDGDSALLCARLREKGVPFLVYSGLPDRAQGPYGGAPYLSKPAPADVLVTAVGKLLRAAPAADTPLPYRS